MDPLLDIFRALGDPTRLRIARLIDRMELSVGELALLLEQSQPRVSRHIRILDEAGLIERRREGAWVFLRRGPSLSDTAIADLLTEPSLAPADLLRDEARLGEVRDARARAANLYFDTHADAWDSIRSLHVAEDEVEAAMARLLGARDIGRLLDIGTGTGRMAELFGHEASHVVALDNSPEMLRLARARVGGLADGRVELMLGDFTALPLEDARFDTVLFHQVLHFAQDPARAIAEAARVLAPSGRLMIVDFAAHDHEELRRDHAHARLGFEDQSIADWFAQAGIRMAHGQELAGGTLAVKIWLGQKQDIPRIGGRKMEKAA